MGEIDKHFHPTQIFEPSLTALREFRYKVSETRYVNLEIGQDRFHMKRTQLGPVGKNQTKPKTFYNLGASSAILGEKMVKALDKLAEEYGHDFYNDISWLHQNETPLIRVNIHEGKIFFNPAFVEKHRIRERPFVALISDRGNHTLAFTNKKVDAVSQVVIGPNGTGSASVNRVRQEYPTVEVVRHYNIDQQNDGIIRFRSEFF